MVIVRRAAQVEARSRMSVERQGQWGNITERLSLSLHTQNKHTHHNTYRVLFCFFAKISHAIEKGPEIKQMYTILIEYIRNSEFGVYSFF